MSRDTDSVFDAISRWESRGLIDPDMAATLRLEISESSTEDTRKLSQYVLAVTGAVVLVLAAGVFLDWAWPQMGERARATVLAVAGLGVLVGGISMEAKERWRPAAYLMQTAGLVLILVSYAYTKLGWADGTLGGTIIGFVSLATPIVLTPRAMKRNTVMPAVHLSLGLAFLAIFLDRSTSLSAEATIWTLDGVLLATTLVLIGVVRRDPEGERHPWALNAFVTSMVVGFVLVPVTCVGVFDWTDETLVPIDLWLALCVGLTLWGIHRAPPGLQRAWFERLLAYEMFAWIVLGSITASETLNAGPEGALLLVGGVGVLAFLHADRHHFRTLMTAASFGFIVPVWWWSVDRGGALGGVAALVATAGFLFWASGRRGKEPETIA